jgi:glycerol-3-phosphate acyltransferase PlsY
MIATLLVCLCAGYLLGSIPFGPIVARAHGVDLRSVASGNIGATNVTRALGKGWGLLVLGLDAAKAAGPIWLCPIFIPPGPVLPWAQVTVGAGAFLGHLFPLFLRFRGGKGVATALGAFLALCPQAAGLGVLTYVVALLVFRISAVGSLCALLLFPLWLWTFAAPLPQWCLAGLVTVFILLRHTGNIRRLLRRQEYRL